MITHEGGARGRYHKPLRIFPVYPVILWYNLFVAQVTAGFDRKLWWQKPVLTGEI